MRSNRVVAFAHDLVGAKILNFLLDAFSSDVKFVVINGSDEKSQPVFEVIKKHSFDSEKILCYSEDLANILLKLHDKEPFDYFLLLWWPKIISDNIINIPKKAVINTHPSLLPYCRGKDPNFWSLVEDAPFGVSLHEVETGIDNGPVICQREIPKTWLDNGKTLYEKSLKEIVQLFMDNYAKIRTGNYITLSQDLKQGSFHLRKELDPASEISLNKNYTGRELLNLLRARTFSDHPGCWFEENGKIYEVKIDIKNKVV